MSLLFIIYALFTFVRFSYRGNYLHPCANSLWNNICTHNLPTANVSLYRLYYRLIVLTWRDGNLSCANVDLRIRSFANWLQIELYINLLPAANTVFDTSGCKYSLLQIYLNPGVNSIYLFIFTFFAHSLREKNERIYKFSVDSKRSVKQSHWWCASYTHLHVPLYFN